MSLALFDISGKVAMATGGTRGLGEVAAKALAGDGADVAVCGRNRRHLPHITLELRSERFVRTLLDVVVGSDR